MHGSGCGRDECPTEAWISQCFCSFLFIYVFFNLYMCRREWVAVSSAHRLSYESGSKLAAWMLNLISTHWISDSNLSVLCERWDSSPSSIYVTMTVQYEGVLLTVLRSVLSFDTLHLLSYLYGDHCSADLRAETWTGVHLQTTDVIKRFCYSCLQTVFDVTTAPALKCFGKLSFITLSFSVSWQKLGLMNCHKTK